MLGIPGILSKVERITLAETKARVAFSSSGVGGAHAALAPDLSSPIDGLTARLFRLHTCQRLKLWHNSVLASSSMEAASLMEPRVVGEDRSVERSPLSSVFYGSLVAKRAAAGCGIY